MTYYQQARRLMNLRVYLIVAVVLVGIVFSLLGDRLQNIVVQPCEALPAYRADVPDDLRNRLALLHERGLLLCSDPVEGLAPMQERIYWGSDGLNSILFFQPEDVGQITLTRYGFGTATMGEAFVPGEPGASPPAGFREVTIGQPARSNQAPEGATYFVRVHGAPISTDSVVSVSLAGPAIEAAGLSERDFFRDLELLWGRLMRRPERVVGNTVVRVPIPIAPSRWEEHLARAINPSFADDEGLESYRALVDAAPDRPDWYKVENGSLATTVWVAGVVSGTNPVLVLAAASDQEIEPSASALWASNTTDLVLAHFAFAPLEAGSAYEARYWNERRDRDAGAAPDRRWPVTVP